MKKEKHMEELKIRTISGKERDAVQSHSELFFII